AKGSFSGDMRLIKQGDGKLVLPAGTHLYSGKTEVWAGTVALDGELSNSPVWMNNFAVLETSSLKAPKGVDMNYASVIRLGDKANTGVLTTGELTLGFGSIIELDAFADQSIDQINAAKLIVEKKDWTNGPDYLQPIIKFTAHQADADTPLPTGKYLIGEIGEIDGNLSDIILLGIDDMKKELIFEDGKLYANLSAYQPGIKTWMGSETAMWDLDHSYAFKNMESGSEDVFVPGDEVIFDDSALTTDIVIDGLLKPSAVTFKNNEKDFTLSGEGQIVGNTKFVKEGNGTLTINNINSYTGGTYINGGKLIAGVFSNDIGNDLGALSDVNSKIYLNNDATLSINKTGTIGQRIAMQNGNATIEVPNALSMTMTAPISAVGLGQKLHKRGKGTLNLAAINSINRLVIEEGSVFAYEINDVISLPSTVEFVNGSLWDPANMSTYSNNSTNYFVADGNRGSLYLDSRCSYTGKLSGKGTLSVYAAGVRCDLKGNWSDFEGELIAGYYKRGNYEPDFKWDNNYGMPKATLNISSGVTFNAQAYNI
ncbi:MAG: autotransporter-associated beta strand repeat-containing protein, partial [Muribaculaceae bacterium]|nr:autotransporter-associated beta strand repeat-containing protein [Muribaculaceae bacterium]